MVPGIAEREMRTHANRRLDWLSSGSRNRASATSVGKLGARIRLGSALIQARRMLGNLVGRQAARQIQPELTRPVRLETARH